MSWIFFACVLLVFYIYAGYPCVMALWARVSPRNVVKKKSGWVEGQTCSIILATHEDGAAVRHKLALLFRSAQERYVGEVLVGVDGSREDVESLLGGMDRVRVVRFAERRGKPAVLNDLAALSRHEYLVMMDARQVVAEGAIPALLAGFEDEQVGVISGELVITGEESLLAGETVSSQTKRSGEEGAYWRYEKWIRKNEARVGSVPGATGACYAIRKSLFSPIPPETMIDDVAIPMQAVMRGFRCIFEEQAVVYDRPAKNISLESVRKRRTLAGNVQILQLFVGILIPWRNPIWFQYISHKVLRLFSPFLIMMSLLCAFMGIFVENRGYLDVIYKAYLLAMVIFFILSALGRYGEQKNIKTRICSICWMFFSLNYATWMGVCDALRGKYRVKWDRAMMDA